MKWQNRKRSGNVRRGGGAAGIGIGGLVLVIIVTLMGGNPLPLITGGTLAGPQKTTTELRDDRDEFLAVVLQDTENVWNEVFKDYGMEYKEPQLVLYDNSVRTKCGAASSQVGPFYCSGDETIYIDTSFYDDLKHTFDAPGDFAFAYVLAHEVGHHVQNQLGIMNKVYAQKSSLSEKEFNKLSVKLELQADYFAGVFAKHVQGKGYLEEGDIEEALNAAAGVGDDRIQEMTTGEIRPDKFTHGTSEQRKEWFMRGMKYGDIEHSDTFSEIK